MRTITKAEALKLNLLNLVRDHREKCDETCNVILGSVLEVAEMAGLEFTEQERKLFI